LRVTRDRTTDDEERTARFEANKAALKMIEELGEKEKYPADAVTRLRSEYNERLQQLQFCAENPDDCSGQVATPQFHRLQQNALDVERQTIIHLRNQGIINDDALRRIQRDLDLAETRLTG
jgi:hypothetical protein